MAKIHVNSLIGNDSNAGTEALPKLTYKAAEAAAVAGDEISLMAGLCYSPVNGFFPRLKKNNIKLSAYGLPANLAHYLVSGQVDPAVWDHYPILDGLTYENAGSTGWTHEGSGVWSKWFANTKAKRIWFGSNSAGVRISDRTIGTAYRRTPGATADTLPAITAALSNSDRWHPAGSALGWKLYVYTGSTTINPPDFYGGLAMLICDGATIGAEEGIFVTQCAGARVEHIHVRGTNGEAGRVASATTDTVATDDIIIKECISSCTGVAGIWAIRPGIENNANLRKKISNSYIVDIVADSKSSQYEQDPTTAYSHISTMDMFTVYGNTENCHMWGLQAINSAHVGVTLGGQLNNEPNGCSISDSLVKFDSWVTYGRGIASSRMTNSKIFGITVDGQNVRSQFADGHVVASLWKNFRASIRKPGTDEWAAVESYVYDYGNSGAGEYRYETRQPRDLLVANNTVILPVASGGAYPLLFTTYSSTYPVTEPNPPINADTVRVLNNLVILSESRSWLGCFANGGAIADQQVKNNIIYTSGGADPTVRWAGATVGMNTRAGQTGNMNVDPKLGPDYKPRKGSPAISAGIATGATYPDLDGTAYALLPTIGAYQYIAGVTVMNDRDAMLQMIDLADRDTNPDGNRALLLLHETTSFQVATDNDVEPPVEVITPEEIRLTAKAINLPGEITWTTEPLGIALQTDPNAVTDPRLVNDRILTAAALGTNNSVTITATTTYQGREYKARRLINKVVDGTATALVYAYKRSATAPTDNPGTVTYTFASGITTPAGDALANGWTKTIPAGTNPLYACVASARGTGLTDTIEAFEWAAPVLYSQNGLSTATVFIYKRTATNNAPARPTTESTYTFQPAGLTGHDNGWTTSVPDASGGAYLWVSTATAASVTSTDTIPAGEWAVPQLMAQDGAQGSPGINTATVFLYQRTASATSPSKPASSLTYTFSTRALSGTLGSWSTTAPTSGGAYLHVTTAVASSTTNTATIATTDWSTVALLSQDGGQGPTGPSGTNTATIYGYKRSTTVPANNPGTVTYTFASKSSTAYANSWSTTIPAGTDPLYIVSAVASGTGATDQVDATDWSSPSLLAQSGPTGDPGANSAVAYLYQWGASAPAAPTGTSTFTWATGVNSAYGGSDGWSVSAPANPGTPLLKLWVAAKAVSAAANTTSSTVSYSGASVSAWAQNGGTGPQGNAGMQSATPTVYQWAATIPSGPVGTPTYTWSTGSFGAAPANWSLTPGTSPSPGMTLWAAKVTIIDSANNSTTSFNWSGASITAQGYAGSNGGTGAEGVSYVTAYCASATATATSAPAATAGRNSVPAANSGGLTGTWSKSVPTLSAGQFMYQSDGLYNPANDTVTWSTPYWSTLKVGSLSAISANLGQITGGSIDIGTNATSWHVDSAGNMWSGASTFATAPFKVSNAGVITALSGSFGGSLSAASGTLGDLHMAAGGGIHGGIFTSYAWPASGTAGFYIGPEGLKFGNYPGTRYFNVDQYGDMWAPGFTLVNGQLTLNSTIIQNPTFDSFTASVPGGSYTSTGGTGVRYMNSIRTATPSGGKSPYVYSWTVESDDNAIFITNGSSTSATISLACVSKTAGSSVNGWATCKVTDANGRTASTNFNILVNF